MNSHNSAFWAKSEKIKSLALSLLLLTVFAFCSCDEFIDSGYHYEEAYSQTIPLKEAGSFSLNNINGSINLTSSPNLEVVIKATKYARYRKSDLDKIKIDVIKGDKSVKVETTYEKRNLGAKVDYEITVPEGIDLELVRTVNGRINVSGKFERAELKTVNGSVEAKGEFDWLQAQTTNGSLNLSQVKGRVELKTTNGSIKAELNELSADFSARTTNGSIRLLLNQEPNAYLTARTVNGSITVEYPLTVEGQISRRRIEGKLGNGQGPRVDLQTTNGSISLLRY
ncbi:MAG TPA: hypothetical protein ENO29_10720 [Candidatus Aminicenantes bacterium]|nr:MAG: hypothetical protein C0168_01665 [Candidatus Aminicenantes bacterium]HEK86807.1 hypothetical protein [Candidatus Aminicenantes bacterium]